MNLAGRSAIITGANQGLGRAIATSFVRSGASVLLVARGQELLRQVERELAPLASQKGQVVCSMRGDVSQPESCQAIARRALFFVNGDIHAAVALAADGLHLPEDGPSVEDARRLVGDEMLISRAVHSVDGALRAQHEGADLIQLGTVFETSSKPHAHPVRLEGVRKVCNAVFRPVIGIGGISHRNAAEVLRAGASGVAVIGALFDADDPRHAAAELRSAVSGTTATR